MIQCSLKTSTEKKYHDALVESITLSIGTNAK